MSQRWDYLYAQCWANTAESSYRESPLAHLLVVNIHSFQHMWMSCIYTSPVSEAMFDSNNSASVCILAIFFIKRLHMTLWGSSLSWMPKRRWNSCKGITLIWNNNHALKKVNFLQIRSKWKAVCSLPFADLKKITSSAVRDLLCENYFRFSSFFW